MSILQSTLTAYREKGREADAAYNLYRSYCNGRCPPRVPGMDTSLRLAVRLMQGKTIEEAAAAEYLYRWRLAIKSPDQCGATGAISHHPIDRNPRACVSIFGTPHTIGM